MRFIKPLTISIVLAAGLLLVPPAFAQAAVSASPGATLDNTALAVATCAASQQQASAPVQQLVQVCLTLTGDVAAGSGARTVEFDYDFQVQGLPTTPIGTVLFNLPADPAPAGPKHFADTECIRPVPLRAIVFGNPAFKIVRVTDTSTGQTANLVMRLTAPAAGLTIQFTAGDQTGESMFVPAGAGTCSTSTSPTASPLPLAQTGGFDYRFVLLGLCVVVAGVILLLIGAGRGRSPDTR